VVTDSHNSGQHKDREAAAGEVRRMWRPTPSWTPPGPNQPASARPAPGGAAERPHALGGQGFPGDPGPRPPAQPAPWTQPQNQPQAGPSWTQPAEPTSSWAQPATEPDDFDEAGDDEPDTPGQADPVTAAPASQPGPATPHEDAPVTPVFGGASFQGQG